MPQLDNKDLTKRNIINLVHQLGMINSRKEEVGYYEINSKLKKS